MTYVTSCYKIKWIVIRQTNQWAKQHPACQTVVVITSYLRVWVSLVFVELMVKRDIFLAFISPWEGNKSCVKPSRIAQSRLVFFLTFICVYTKIVFSVEYFFWKLYLDTVIISNERFFCLLSLGGNLKCLNIVIIIWDAWNALTCSFLKWTGWKSCLSVKSIYLQYCFYFSLNKRWREQSRWIRR